jgi:regulator of sigma D
VDKLLVERGQMLILFCRTAGLEPYRSSGPVQAVLQQFCQVLVDYIAAGHFALYGRILDGSERRQELLRLAEKLYPRISETTDVAVDFNDKYDCGDDCDIPESLADDLSRLGEQLALRIELEDQLIGALRARR